MDHPPKDHSPERSLSAFVESMAHLLRTEVKENSLKGRGSVLKNKTGSAHKIETIAALLRHKVHETKKTKPRRTKKPASPRAKKPKTPKPKV